MSPFLSYTLLFKIFPALVRLGLALVGANTLLSQYYSWIEKRKTQKEKWAWAAWCLGFYLPLVAAIFGMGCIFWFMAPKEAVFAFYIDRTAGAMSMSLSLIVLLAAIWTLFHPQKPGPKGPRMRTWSRTRLGY